MHERLVIYKRLASVETSDELDGIQRGARSTGSALPEPAQALIASHRLAARSRGRSASRKSMRARIAAPLQFAKEPGFDPGKLILLVQRDGRVRFAGPDKVRIERAAPALSDRVALVKEFLAKVGRRIRPSAPLGHSGRSSSRRWPDCRVALVKEFFAHAA